MKYLLISSIFIVLASLWGASRWLEQEPVIIPELVEVVDVKAPGPVQVAVNTKTGLTYINGRGSISVMQGQEEIAHFIIGGSDVIKGLAVDQENGWVLERMKGEGWS